jgi:hypothetical protein
MRSITMLAQEAAAQQGLLTVGQLRALGESKDTISNLVRAGLLRRVHRGVYVVFGSPETWRLRVLAAVLAGGGRAVASHRTALGLWDLWSDVDTVEVAVRYPNHLVLDDVIVHRSLDLCGSDIQDVDGTPTTGLERTLCDIGLLVGPTELRRLVFHSVTTGLTTKEALEIYLDRVGRQGRNGVGPLRQVLEDMPSVVADSGPELELYSLLTTCGLPSPQTQYKIRFQQNDYRVDLAYPNERVAIEYDGFVPHSQKSQFERDRQRQNAFVLNGWTVLRFTAVDLRDRPYGIVREVRDALRAIS